ncbi:MAG: hypothetical protein Q7T20_06780 [Saprospiraceae bacterium]|nr:hypothetical protein [Saprospiraceae bacterium]
MLSFFRSNQFFVAIPLALYVIIVHLGALMGTLQPPAPALDHGLLYQSWFGWVETQPFYSALTATFLVFIQAVSVNVWADEYRLMGERNWFPGLFYTLLVSALPDFLFVSAPLVAATFLPFSLWRIFKAYQKPNVAAAIFDGALWIAVASLFYPPSLWLLVAGFTGLGVVRVFRLHERFIFFTGIFAPLFLVWLWYFWADRGVEFRDAQWGNLFQIYRFDAVFDAKMLYKTMLVAFLAFFSLLGIGSLSNRKGIQSQKFAGVLYWFLAVGVLSLLLRPVWRWEQLLLPAAASGILLSHAFQSMRNRFWAELWHFCILAFVLFIQFADYFINLSDSLF